MSFFPLVVILGVLAVVVLALLFYRSRLTATEDDTLHVNPGEESYVSEQAALAKKLAVIDRWGKVLTAIVVIGGLVLGVVYVYLTFIASTAVRMG